jgi:membrane-bound lytic murein transglycosylase B
VVFRRLNGLAVDHLISEAELARAHDDPRFKQVLLARSLEQLLDTLYRNQHLAFEPAGAQSLRDGAAMAVRLADQIRAIDERLSVDAKKPPAR